MTRPPSSGPPIDRRVFVKNALVASAAAAIAPVCAAAAQETRRSGIEWKRAPCRLCGVGCGLLVGIEGGRAVAVKGDPTSPVSKGLACVKGYYAPQILYGRDRITRALVRRNGGMAEASLSAAYDMIANRIRETIRRHGPDSVALYGSAQWSLDDAYVAARFFRGALGSTSIDTSARLHTASASAGLFNTFGSTAIPGTYEDIDHADVFILWNVNLAESDPVLFSRMLERRRTSPAVRIVDLSTLSTRTSYAANRSFLFVPCTELAIANAICHEIVGRGLANRAFVDRHVAFKRGQADFTGTAAADALLNDSPTTTDWAGYVRFLEEYSLERVRRLSGLAIDDIKWLASLYGDPTRAVVSVWGSPVNEQARGTWLNNALHNIHLLVGKVATPGNAAIPVAGQPGGAALLDDPFGHRGLPEDTAAQRRLAQVWGVNPAALDKRPARPALSIFRSIERGDVRFLWIQATNPLVSLPNLGRFRKALGAADCFVVVSDAYPNPTTDVADVVLPAAMWIEREGAYVNGERRIERLEQLVRPPGDATSDAGHMIEVARQLGYTSRFPWSRRTAGEIWDEFRAGRGAPSLELPDQASLQSTAGLLWPTPNAHETRRRYNAADDPAVDRTHGTFDFYDHADHKAWIWLRPHAPPAETPSREFPFWLTTGRVVEHWGTGTLTRRVPTLHRAVPNGYVEINPDDARVTGVRDGDRVRLTSRRGTVELEARIAYRSQPPRGLLFATAFDESAPVNMLTRDDSCPISGQPAKGACAVRVERVERRS